jgi:hypothetical protein
MLRRSSTLAVPADACLSSAKGFFEKTVPQVEIPEKVLCR